MAESANGTAVPPAPSIETAAGVVWTLSADRKAACDGHDCGWAPLSATDPAIQYVDHVVWVHSAGGYWYATNAAGAIVPPGKKTLGPAPTESPNGTMVPPAANIRDAKARTWSISPTGQALCDGNDMKWPATVAMKYVDGVLWTKHGAHWMPECVKVEGTLIEPGTVPQQVPVGSFSILVRSRESYG